MYCIRSVNVKFEPDHGVIPSYVQGSGKHGNLVNWNGSSATQIPIAGMTLLLYSCISIKSFIRQIQTMADHAKQTILDWLSLLREACSMSTSNMRKLEGTASMPLQIRQSYFTGRPEYKLATFLHSVVDNVDCESEDCEGSISMRIPR